MICGGREEREPVSPPRTLQNDHVSTENDAANDLLEANLHVWLTDNVAGYMSKDLGDQELMRNLGRAYCLDHQIDNFAHNMQRAYLDARLLEGLMQEGVFAVDGSSRSTADVQAIQFFVQGPPSETPTLVYFATAPPSDAPTLAYHSDDLTHEPVFDDSLSNASTLLR